MESTSAPLSRIQRRPVGTNYRDRNQSEPRVDDEVSLSAITGDSRTLTISEADIQKLQPKVKYQTAVYHIVGLGEDKHVPLSSGGRNTIARLIQDWWLNELLGLVISVLTFTAIVIVLMLFEDRALPEWPYNISLNTFLALFITIATTSLMIAVSEGLSS